jgi:predicted nuclease of restriction endonuclease-like RecB superfamily
VALAQGVLFKAVRVEAVVRGETPARFRQLLRKVKFHRLICDVHREKKDGDYRLILDGPLSLFSATQKYGLQLASFLPSLLLCRRFEMTADLRWGPQRLPRNFTLCSDDGLVSHLTDTGTYVPPELTMFVELFRKKITGWEIQEEAELVPLGDGYWAPDFCLVHSASGQRLYLEVLGFWRRSSLDKHLERLRAQVKTPFLLAVSDQLHVEEEELEGLPAGVIRFRQMPLPEEVIARAEEMLS